MGQVGTLEDRHFCLCSSNAVALPLSIRTLTLELSECVDIKSRGVGRWSYLGPVGVGKSRIFCGRDWTGPPGWGGKALSLLSVQSKNWGGCLCTSLLEIQCTCGHHAA